MHRGNSIAYTGPDLGVNSIWRPGNVLRWDGAGWHLVRLDGNSRHMYLTALPDIVRGTPRQIAESVLTNTLLTDNLFAETMFATLIESEVVNILCRLNVGNTANGIQIRGGGSTDANDSEIRSANFVEGVSGVRIRGDGRFDATHARISGGLASGAFGVDGNIVNPSWNNGLLSPWWSTGNTRARALISEGSLTLSRNPNSSARPTLTVSEGTVFKHATISRIHTLNFIRGTFTRIELGDALTLRGVPTGMSVDNFVLIQGWVQTPENMGFGNASAVTSISSRMVSGVLRHVLRGPNLGNVSGTEQEWVLNTTAQIRAYIVFI